uniref:LicD/FKTN/FKRP nucleotidyltransferase domain-containing protein n=1 Tax=Trypanosoma congolense (strain IL3000) TaxID=1068625 RepID=G0UML3_TRYCI|nr:conserved hypothetical protein [Trypanosoma congolense IL3000]
MPLDAQKLLFHLARRAGTAAPLRWYPTAAENKLFERLDVSGAPTAQAVYANVVQSRFRPHLLPAETSICLESFADELVPCAGDSYRLRCSVSGSRLMKRLVVPAAVRAVMHELLRDVLRVLHRAGICCWAAGGTLLGAVRHGGIIPWDDDVDIGIANEDEARLRAAFGYPCADSTGSRLSEGCSPARMSDCGDSHELVLEYVPLFGYKCTAALCPRRYPRRHCLAVTHRA